mmetsp:Transcript_22864/g.52504  ORF Transcript_22864/g.52504 Transcript_22864/m.52504 type:complete len:311 (-) Transcript_22864:392-1324(-)
MAIERRVEEIDALLAYYGEENVSSSLVTATLASPGGPWFVRLGLPPGEEPCAAEVAVPTLEIQLANDYPLGESPPTPVLHNFTLSPSARAELLSEMVEAYEADMEVGILWGEMCNDRLSTMRDMLRESKEMSPDKDVSASDDGRNGRNGSKVRSFIPPSGKYGQPIRHFNEEIISCRENRRTFLSTDPFRPPRSGPGELFVAHVCECTRFEHVQTALAQLLFENKKVSKASHNMFAYSMTLSDGTKIKDNDDDGEGGSGAKLAMLLELTKVDNVLVVVSRWFGGLHLGNSRFKYIAQVGRDGLEKAGLLK